MTYGEAKKQCEKRKKCEGCKFFNATWDNYINDDTWCKLDTWKKKQCQETK